MADQIQTGSGGGGNGGLYFVVGSLVVVVGIGAFFMFGGKVNTGSGTNIKIEAPKAPAPKTQ